MSTISAANVYAIQSLQKQLQYLHLHTQISMLQLVQNAGYSQLRHATSKLPKQHHVFALRPAWPAKERRIACTISVARLQCLYLLMT